MSLSDNVRKNVSKRFFKHCMELGGRIFFLFFHFFFYFPIFFEYFVQFVFIEHLYWLENLCFLPCFFFEIRKVTTSCFKIWGDGGGGISPFFTKKLPLKSVGGGGHFLRGFIHRFEFSPTSSRSFFRRRNLDMVPWKFWWGCMVADLPHFGHINFLKKSREAVKKEVGHDNIHLIVGLMNDEVVESMSICLFFFYFFLENI